MNNYCNQRCTQIMNIFGCYSRHNINVIVINNNGWYYTAVLDSTYKPFNKRGT